MLMNRISSYRIDFLERRYENYGHEFINILFRVPINVVALCVLYADFLGQTNYEIVEMCA